MFQSKMRQLDLYAKQRAKETAEKATAAVVNASTAADGGVLKTKQGQ